MAIARSPILRAAALTVAVLAAATQIACTSTQQQSALPQSVATPAAPVAERAAYLTSLIQEHVKAGRIPGAVMMVAQGGQVIYSQAVGLQDPQAGVPMQQESIFRIYSMTKPIVSVAVLQLVEQGRVRLEDPVGNYLPELANLRVGTVHADGRGGFELQTAPATRPITVQDLLRHTSGITYGIFGKGPVKKQYLDAQVHASPTNAELVSRLGKVPLLFEPGTVWEYSHSTDVLGALVEQVTGKTLDVALREQILEPLGMQDTGFWVPEDKRARQAEAFSIDPDSKRPVTLLDVSRPPSYLSGGGGMVSTASDYLRFAQMLLNRGELDGVRLLSPDMVEFMTSDHLGPAGILEASRKRGAAYLPGPGYGFGLGVAVRTDEGGPATPGNVGDYNWGGLGGTYFWVDPRADMAAVWMMQAPGQRTQYRSLYRNLVYGMLP